jgi:hypothetical protein
MFADKSIEDFSRSLKDSSHEKLVTMREGLSSELTLTDGLVKKFDELTVGSPPPSIIDHLRELQQMLDSEMAARESITKPQAPNHGMGHSKWWYREPNHA